MIINNLPEIQMQNFTQGPKLAQAYVPYQQYGNLLPIEEALYKGTIFNDLYQPHYKQFT